MLHHNKAIKFLKFLPVLFLTCLMTLGCDSTKKVQGPVLLGTYKVIINPGSGTTTYTPAGNSPLKQFEEGQSTKLDPLFNLGWDRSINYASGTIRIEPVNCANADYNAASGILTGSGKLINRTAEGGSLCPTGAETYCDETYIAPIEIRVYSIYVVGICDKDTDPYCENPLAISDGTPELTQAHIVSFNLDSGCSNVTDSDSDGYIDCMADDPHYIYTEPDYPEYKDHPTWDYTYKCDQNDSDPAQALEPAEESGCKFLQFTFVHPELDSTHIPIIGLYADVLGYIQGEGLPLPTVAAVTTPTRLSSQIITVTIDTGLGADSAKITGGVTDITCAITDSTEDCQGDQLNSTIAINVDLKANQTNHLYVYQLDAVPVLTNQSAGKYTPIVHDDISPLVTEIAPQPGSTNVSPYANVLITFNEPVDPSYINTNTILLYRGATQVTGTVTLSSDYYTATFNPTSVLTGSSLHTVTVKGGTLPCTACVKDTAGNPISSDYTSTFTTAGSDTTPPTVTSTNPPDNASGVSLDTTIQIHFSEAIDTATLTTPNANINVKQGTTAITGTLTLSVDGMTATFTPNDAVHFSPPDEFNENTEYTITVDSGTSGIKDLAGLALQADYVFTFRTGLTADATRPDVVSATPVNNATGVSEYISPEIIFSEAIDPATVTSGNIYIKKRSDESIISSTLNQSADGITVVIDPVFPLENNETTYVITIGELLADLSGNYLLTPQTVQFTTAAGADTIAPNVVRTTPVDQAQMVSTYTGLVVEFSEPVDTNTVSTGTLILQSLDKSGNPTGTVSGTVTLAEDKLSATFTQSNPPLNNGADYRITVKGGTLPCTTCVKDLAGNPMVSDFTSKFSTCWRDETNPYVKSVVPANGSTLVSTNSNIDVTFSEPVLASTVTDVSFYLLKQGNATHVPGLIQVLNDGVNARFNPTNDLDASSTYVFYTTTAITDLAYRAMSAATTTSFSTDTGPDSTGPSVTAIDPAGNESNVARWKSTTVTFNEAIDPYTVSSSTVEIIRNNDSSKITSLLSVSSDAKSVVINPIDLLPNYEWFTVNVKNGIRNLSGLALQDFFTSQFRTINITSDPAPTVSSTDPANGATKVPITKTITINMSEPIDPDNAVLGTFNVERMSGGVAWPQDGDITVTIQTGPNGERSQIILDPQIDFKKNSDFRITVTTDVHDDANNHMTATFYANFST